MPGIQLLPEICLGGGEKIRTRFILVFVALGPRRRRRCHLSLVAVYWPRYRHSRLTRCCLACFRDGVAESKCSRGQKTIGLDVGISRGDIGADIKSGCNREIFKNRITALAARPLHVVSPCEEDWQRRVLNGPLLRRPLCSCDTGVHLGPIRGVYVKFLVTFKPRSTGWTQLGDKSLRIRWVANVVSDQLSGRRHGFDGNCAA